MADTVPHNIEAEQAVLGAIFIDPTVLTDVALIVTEPRMFYRRSHDCTYKAMLALRDAGREIDWVHVLEAVGVAGDLEACGGREMLSAYLSDISHAVPSAYGAEGYATIVRNNYARREIHFSGREIDKLALDPTKSPTEIIEILERKVVALDAINTSNALKRIGDGCDQAVVEQVERTQLRETHGELINGMSSGFADMDAYTGGWKGGEFIAIGAEPGDGKTSLLLDIARRNMERPEPNPGVIISLEMRERSLRFKLMCAVANVNTLAANAGGLTEAEQWEWEQAAEKIKNWPLYVVDGKRGLKMRQIRSICYQAVERFGVKWVMIDYLQYIKKSRFMQDTFEHVSDCSRACKMLAGELDVPVIAAVQLKPNDSKRVKKPKPSLDSFRYSGEIRQDIDGAWLIHTTAFHRDKPCDVTLIAAKTRLGMTGEVAMQFHRATGRFEPAPVGANDAAYKDYTEKEAPEVGPAPSAKVATGNDGPAAKPADTTPKAGPEKQILEPGAEDDPRKEAPQISKAEAREMFKTPAQGGKAIRV